MDSQLTSSDRAFMAELIAEANLFDPRTANARLLQAEKSISKLTQAMRIALKNGDPEDSPYVNRLVSRIAALIENKQQLEALVGQKTIAA